MGPIGRPKTSVKTTNKAVVNPSRAKTSTTPQRNPEISQNCSLFWKVGHWLGEAVPHRRKTVASPLSYQEALCSLELVILEGKRCYPSVWAWTLCRGGKSPCILHLVDRWILRYSVRTIVGLEADLRRKTPQALDFVTEACYRCDIIVAPCARLPEVANITVYELVRELFNSDDSDLLG